MSLTALRSTSVLEIATRGLPAPSSPIESTARPAIQSGPAYRCFLCGCPAKGLIYWPTGAKSPSPLDLYAAHIAYLHPTCRCHLAHVGCTRVAVTSAGAITPLRFASPDEILDWHQMTAYNIGAVQAALALLDAVAAAGVVSVVDPAGTLLAGVDSASDAQTISDLRDELALSGELIAEYQNQLAALRPAVR